MSEKASSVAEKTNLTVVTPNNGANEPPSPTEWDARLEITLNGHERSISCVKYSPDGCYLASASSDMKILIFSVHQNFKLIAQLEGHTRGINDLSWSPDSRHLASASDDTTIIVWAPQPATKDANNQDIIQGWTAAQTLKGHSNYVFCLDWAPTGGLLASGSFDESIRLWDVRGGGKVRRVIAAHADPVTAVTFSPDGSVLASASYDGLVRLWDCASGRCLKTIVGEENPPVGGLRFAPNGRYLLASALDGSLRLWAVHTGQCAKMYKGHHNERYCLSPLWLIPQKENNGDGNDNCNDHDNSNENDDERVEVIMGSEDGRVLRWMLNEPTVFRQLLAFPSSSPTTSTPSVIMSVSINSIPINGRFQMAVASLRPPEIKIFSW